MIGLLTIERIELDHQTGSGRALVDGVIPGRVEQAS